MFQRKDCVTQCPSAVTARKRTQLTLIHFFPTPIKLFSQRELCTTSGQSLGLMGTVGPGVLRCLEIFKSIGRSNSHTSQISHLTLWALKVCEDPLAAQIIKSLQL
jgi:hypothetical protein